MLSSQQRQQRQRVADCDSQVRSVRDAHAAAWSFHMHQSSYECGRRCYCRDQIREGALLSALSF